jgi:hypothetical protein
MDVLLAKNSTPVQNSTKCPSHEVLVMLVGHEVLVPYFGFRGPNGIGPESSPGTATGEPSGMVGGVPLEVLGASVVPGGNGGMICAWAAEANAKTITNAAVLMQESSATGF